MSQERSIATLESWRIGLYRLFAVLAACVALTACATGPTLVVHTFSFDARQDSPDVEILDYRYGDSRQPGARAEPERVAQGRIAQQLSVRGEMLRGDVLYVKWRIKRTGKEFEDTVDLRSRLPANITNHRVHFVIKGSQLHIYLVSTEPNPSGWPTYSPPGYVHLKTYEIYPDRPRSK